MFFRTWYFIVFCLGCSLVHHNKTDIWLVSIHWCNTCINPHIITDYLITKIISCLLTSFLTYHTVYITIWKHSVPVVFFLKQMSIVNIVNPAWNIVYTIIATIATHRIAYYNTIYIHTAKQTYFCSHRRTDIIWLSAVINLKIITAYYLGRIF